jgi:hypothetical protein
VTDSTDVARAMTFETCKGCDGFGWAYLGLYKSGATQVTCNLCRGTGRIARPSFTQESAIGAPDETDGLRAEIAKLTRRVDGLAAALQLLMERP